MTVFQIISILITLTAVFSYVNHRFIKLPATIGVMLISLLVSLALIGIGRYAPAPRTTTRSRCCARSIFRPC